MPGDSALSENVPSRVVALLMADSVRKVICSLPRQSDSYVFDKLYRAGKIELEIVPQSNLAERIRAAGSGICAFFSPTSYDTLLAEGKETREIDGRMGERLAQQRVTPRFITVPGCSPHRRPTAAGRSPV